MSFLTQLLVFRYSILLLRSFDRHRFYDFSLFLVLWKKDFFLFYFVRTSHTFYFPTHCTLHGKSLQIYIHIFLFSTSIFNFSLKFQFLSPRYLCKLLTFLSEFEKGILCNVRMSLHLTKIKWNQMKNKICKDHLLRFSWANVNELIAAILKFFVPVARDCRLFGFWLH